MQTQGTRVLSTSGLSQVLHSDASGVSCYRRNPANMLQTVPYTSMQPFYYNTTGLWLGVQHGRTVTYDMVVFNDTAWYFAWCKFSYIELQTYWVLFISTRTFLLIYLWLSRQLVQSNTISTIGTLRTAGTYILARHQIRGQIPRKYWDIKVSKALSNINLYESRTQRHS